MNELIRTALFCLVAVTLVVAASVVDPGAVRPEIFSDQGQVFYPQFTDPQSPKVIEVIDYDETTATARPLKVEFKNNRWTLPSHYGYPADAESRLANTAAALIELHKDVIISDRMEDHAKYGVIDPLDQSATSLVGRGKRVTLRDGNGAVLVDFIVGKPAEDKPGYRYLRVPNQRRTYAAKTDADVSVKFEDWIETDLLKLGAADIRKITINRYSINEMFGILENVETVVLSKAKNQWSVSGGGAPRKGQVETLVGALDNLRIVDVQPKPKGLSRDLQTPEGIRLSPESILSLRQKGFFITPMGQLLSNEGEITVETTSGLLYTLRFGEIAGGASPTPDSDSQTKESPEDPKELAKGQDERRYLFITVHYNPERARQYAEGGIELGDKGRALERELRSRFADWYYVISGGEFNKLRPGRQELTKG